jgi:hypothetical protein
VLDVHHCLSEAGLALFACLSNRSREHSHSCSFNRTMELLPGPKVDKEMMVVVVGVHRGREERRATVTVQVRQ